MKVYRNSWKGRFFTIAGGQTVSIIGSSAVQFSLIWWLASETGSPLLMSMAGLAAFLPQVVLGPFAGVWIDRLRRKTVIICADLFIALIAALFALSFLVSAPPYWSVCVVLGLRGVGNVFHTPAIQAVVPLLVPQDKLIKANGWSQFLQSGAYMLAPVIGAALYAAFSMPVILLTDVAGAVIASATVAVVSIPEIEREQRQKPDFARELREGVTVYLGDKKLSAVTLTIAISLVFFMPLSSLYPLITSDYFGGTAWHASAIQLAYSLGMMLGAVIISQMEIRNKLLAVQAGMVALGITAFLCGILPENTIGFWLFAGICLLMGGSMNLYNIPYMAYLQETIPKEAQGRAFSLVGSLMSVTMPVGLLVAGPAAEHLGVTVWFLISGLLIVAVMAIGGLVMRKKSLR